jgi:predicted HTH transcriptional regulator
MCFKSVGFIIFFLNLILSTISAFSRDLAELVSSGLFEQIGITGKGTAYILRRQRRHNDAI